MGQKQGVWIFRFCWAQEPFIDLYIPPKVMKTLVRKNMISYNKCHAKTRKRCLGTSGLRISSASAATLFMPRHARELRQYISSLPNIYHQSISSISPCRPKQMSSLRTSSPSSRCRKRWPSSRAAPGVSVYMQLRGKQLCNHCRRSIVSPDHMHTASYKPVVPKSSSHLARQKLVRRHAML